MRRRHEERPRALRRGPAPAWLACWVCGWALAGGAAGADDEAFDPARFEVVPLVAGLRQPMELAVAPDGTVYWIEFEGRLLCLPRGETAPRLVGEVTVTTAQENGLIGLALAPDFAATGHVYLQYSPPDFEGQHVSRFTIRDGRLDPASEKLLLEFQEQRKECCHHAGSLAFGPDGCLYVASGDNTHPHGDSAGYAPIDERPGMAPWDAQKSSANTASLSGKILRIRPLPDGTMEIPAGNLFPADGSAGRPEIYCMGCRNPWRISVDGRSGAVYWGEVGPDAGGDGPRGPRGYDEINQALGPGNFGWPYFIGDNFAYADYDYATGTAGPRYDASGPENASPNNTGLRVLPAPVPALLWYPYGPSERFPELGEGGRTACAGPVYHEADFAPSPTRFPAHYDGCLFIYEWTRNWIKAVRLDGDQRPVSIEPFLPGQPFVRPIDMQFGPEGALYLIEYGDTWGVNANARIVRIDYHRGNRPPVAVATATNNIGREPLEVRLSSAGTSDRDGDGALAYRWRAIRAAGPDAAPEPPRTLSTEPSPTVTFDHPGVYTVELEVTDPAGAARTATVPVVVGNTPPEVRFAAPLDGDFLEPDRMIEFRVVVRDREDGTNDADAADAEGIDELESADVARASVQASRVAAGGPAAAPPGLALMRKSDCFNCHAVDQPRVGPPLVEVALRYRGKEGAVDASVERVQKGSTGVWGKIPMLPHSHHTVEEIREMVAWIHALEPATLSRVFTGFAGTVPATGQGEAGGRWRLEATYLDRGAGDIPPLAGSATIHLRPRDCEAEHADEIRGPQVLGGASAGGGRFLGAIDHGHAVRFSDVALDRVGGMVLRLASAGAGGAVEIRRDAPDGPLLGTVTIEVNGHWEEFYERAVTWEPVAGRHDVWLVFTHPQRDGGRGNLDGVRWLP
ncbi:MAG: PQQ-dependent sugar dehydrogenase [Planctomycetaceae bacterium]